MLRTQATLKHHIGNLAVSQFLTSLQSFSLSPIKDPWYIINIGPSTGNPHHGVKVFISTTIRPDVGMHRLKVLIFLVKF